MLCSSVQQALLRSAVCGGGLQLPPDALDGGISMLVGRQAAEWWVDLQHVTLHIFYPAPLCCIIMSQMFFYLHGRGRNSFMSASLTLDMRRHNLSLRKFHFF